MSADVERAGFGGRFVVLVGPDGVGKTTVAQALVSRRTGRSGYFHFRPPFKPPLLKQPTETQPLPKFDGRILVPMGWLRLAKNFVLFWLGFLGSVRPAIRSGHLVVGDRWAYGYLAQPRSLRFGGPQWLARLVIRALPSPDLVVNLVAPVNLIIVRKAELTFAEIEAELAAWRELSNQRVLTVDASRSISEIVDEIESRLDL